MKIILASGSPRRKELLKLIVPEFEVIVSGVNGDVRSSVYHLYQYKFRI